MIGHAHASASSYTASFSFLLELYIWRFLSFHLLRLRCTTCCWLPLYFHDTAVNLMVGFMIFFANACFISQNLFASIIWIYDDIVITRHGSRFFKQQGPRSAAYNLSIYAFPLKSMNAARSQPTYRNTALHRRDGSRRWYFNILTLGW